MRVKLYNQIIDYIEKDLPMDDSLNIKLPYLLGVTTFLSNEGPYETLKSRGLETINNDSLRLKIALYYDFEYEKIKTNEKQHYEHYVNNLKPLMIEHFDLSNYKLKPINYDSLFDDFRFKQTINWALRTDQYMLELYRNLHKNGETLIKELNDEISLIH
ncbi:hypothetical protein [Psychroserpens luteolus]|uniref:hypothetical protein n=1 Tax=Psychroserpens luteolus TaxID=2855840 RepID=UPI001E379D8C|nr:hypothetical protein [Psychroserpens luteolus]MCD2260749.1 hypothetical protein [Psychroserpens luteolus]